MPDRLRFDVHIPPDLRSVRFPAMALLTLVENAVRHGIDPAERGGEIEVGADRRADGTVRVWVADTGAGMSEAAQPGTGLTNLRARLQASFGASATLDLTEQAPSGLRATISFQPAAR
jgi:LytS/YehU family sensor histidine kinase